MNEKQIFNPQYRTVIARLKTVRKERGFTQAEVARRMGVGRSWVSKIECHEHGLDLHHLVGLCQVYGLRAHEIIRLMEA